MPKPFAGLCLQVDKPGRCYLNHPVTGGPLVIGKPPAADETTDAIRERQAYVEVVSWHSTAAQDFRFEHEDRLRRERRELSSREEFDHMGSWLARMTTGWRLAALTGEAVDIECSYDIARDLYNAAETRWLRNDVLAFLSNQGNFPLAS